MDSMVSDEYMRASVQKKIQAAFPSSSSAEIAACPKRRCVFAQPGCDRDRTGDASFAKRRLQFFWKYRVA